MLHADKSAHDAYARADSVVMQQLMREMLKSAPSGATASGGAMAMPAVFGAMLRLRYMIAGSASYAIPYAIGHASHTYATPCR